MTGRRRKGLSATEVPAALDRLGNATLKRPDVLSQAQGAIYKMAAALRRGKAADAEAKRKQAVARYRRLEARHRAEMARERAAAAAEAAKKHGECTGEAVPVHGQGTDGVEGRRKEGK